MDRSVYKKNERMKTFKFQFKDQWHKVTSIKPSGWYALLLLISAVFDYPRIFNINANVKRSSIFFIIASSICPLSRDIRLWKINVFWISRPVHILLCKIDFCALFLHGTFVNYVYTFVVWICPVLKYDICTLSPKKSLFNNLLKIIISHKWVG